MTSLFSRQISFPARFGWMLFAFNLLWMLADIWLFHFDWMLAFEPELLLLLLLPTGVYTVHSEFAKRDIELPPFELLSLGIAVSFGIIYVTAWICHAISMQFLWVVFAVVLPFNYFQFLKQKRLLSPLPSSLHWLNIFAAFALLLLTFYILPNLHYTASGGLSATGLFAVDPPCLAGSIHGIREFGGLLDLHQSATPTRYHEATYQILAVLNRNETIADLVFTAPLIGYTLLAFSLFALLVRLTRNELLAGAVAILAFVTGGVLGTEQSSYALSPSLVFGSLLLVNLILLIDIRFATIEGKRQIETKRQRIVWLCLFLFLIFVLSQTKISTYLLLTGALGLFSLYYLLRGRREGWDILLPVAAVFAYVLFQDSKVDPLMPGNDFLIGAPLLGYANHLSAILHVPLEYLNPVSKGTHLRWESIWILPYFVFHVARFVVLDPRLLALAILVIYLKRKGIGLLTENSEAKLVLLLLIPLGFFLPVFYSPAWYPLAFSFYAPLTSAQSAILLVAVFGASIVEWKAPLRYALAALGLVSIGLSLWWMHKDSIAPTYTMSGDMMRALEFLAQEKPANTIVATDRTSLFAAGDESYYWYAALGAHPVISEGSKYGALLAATADTDSTKGLHPVLAAEHKLAQLRSVESLIFHATNDTVSLHRSLTLSNAKFVLIDKSVGDTASTALTQIGTRVFQNSSAEIWRVVNPVIEGTE